MVNRWPVLNQRAGSLFSRLTATGVKRNKKQANTLISNMEQLQADLDNVSTGSESDEFIHASAEDTELYDNNHVNQNSQVPLTEEEREQISQELQKTEDEIATLRQVLQARIKHASELKHKLGVTPWGELQQDIGFGITKIKDSTAVQRTNDLLSSTSDTVRTNMDKLRNSNAFKSFENKVGSAYGTVKAKISASTSIDHLYGRTDDGVPEARPAGSATQPTTPSTEKSLLS